MGLSTALIIVIVILCLAVFIIPYMLGDKRYPDITTDSKTVDASGTITDADAEFIEVTFCKNCSNSGDNIFDSNCSNCKPYRVIKMTKFVSKNKM